MRITRTRSGPGADVADADRVGRDAHALQADVAHVTGLGGAHAQLDLAARPAVLQARERVLDVDAAGRDAVDREDRVAAGEAGLRGRRALERLDHAQAVAAIAHQAQPDAHPRRRDAPQERAVLVGLQVDRVAIVQLGEQRGDRRRVERRRVERPHVALGELLAHQRDADRGLGRRARASRANRPPGRRSARPRRCSARCRRSQGRVSARQTQSYSGADRPPHLSHRGLTRAYAPFILVSIGAM